MHHLKPALLALLAQAPAHAGAFVAPPPSRIADEERPVIAVATAPRAKQLAATAAPAAAQPLGSPDSVSLFAGAAVAGALAALLGRRKGASRDAGCGMRAGIRQNLPEHMGEDPKWRDGLEYNSWLRLRRNSRRDPGRRQRFYRQQKILKEAGVWMGYKKFHVWHKNRDGNNLYKGPDSHPDNPFFPAASGGWPTKALSDAAPAPLMASTPQKSTGLFAGNAAPTFGLAKKRFPRGTFGASRAERRGLVLNAHKKAASSTKNQGHKKRPHFYGVSKKGLQGNAVKVGQMLVKQKGFRWHPGANVSVGRDYRLSARVDGIVQWRGAGKFKEVYVVPWEYVNEKCTWITPSTIAPKKYEPWMGKPHKSHKTHKEQKQRTLIRNHISKIREEWLETEEGKAWAAKKAEKKQKQREIQARIREIRRKIREGKAPAAAREDVAASSAGESESEAES